jgi:Ca-activated chloride channel family protein
MSVKREIWVFLLILGLSTPSHSQDYLQKPPARTRILFLLDGSGSMLGKWGPATRIVVAKKFLSDFVDSLRVNKDLDLALRVYGHQFASRLQRCDDSKLEVPFGKDNHDRIIQRIKQIAPQGNTPIAYSLEQSANDFPDDENARNIIIIITDGIESCKGDPCQVSLSLQKKGIFLRPFIIGIGMDKNYAEQFSCMGKFFDANDISDFRKALSIVMGQSLNKTTVSVELLDENQQPYVSNINISFINNLTAKTVYDFVHYRDNNGLPDTVQIDAVIPYNLRVNTVPPVYKNNIQINPGEHNVIRVMAPQGSLQLSQKNTYEYKEGVKILVRETGTPEVINVQSLEMEEKYLSGNYDLELLTLPRTKYINVLISPKKLTRIEVPSPGLVNILVNFPGYGSLYQVSEDGSASWIYDLDEKSVKFTLAIQPGLYRLVFRTRNSLGSKFTYVNNFKIESNKSLTISY